MMTDYVRRVEAKPLTEEELEEQEREEKERAEGKLRVRRDDTETWENIMAISRELHQLNVSETQLKAFKEIMITFLPLGSPRPIII